MCSIKVASHFSLFSELYQKSTKIYELVVKIEANFCINYAEPLYAKFIHITLYIKTKIDSNLTSKISHK